MLAVHRVDQVRQLLARCRTAAPRASTSRTRRSGARRARTSSSPGCGARPGAPRWRCVVAQTGVTDGNAATQSSTNVPALHHLRQHRRLPGLDGAADHRRLHAVDDREDELHRSTRRPAYFSPERRRPPSSSQARKPTTTTDERRHEHGERRRRRSAAPSAYSGSAPRGLRVKTARARARRGSRSQPRRARRTARRAPSRSTALWWWSCERPRAEQAADDQARHPRGRTRGIEPGGEHRHDERGRDGEQPPGRLQERVAGAVEVDRGVRRGEPAGDQHGQERPDAAGGAETDRSEDVERKASNQYLPHDARRPADRRSRPSRPRALRRPLRLSYPRHEVLSDAGPDGDHRAPGGHLAGRRPARHEHVPGRAPGGDHEPRRRRRAARRRCSTRRPRACARSRTASPR